MRRPLSRTRVEAAPRPRREMPEPPPAKPVPKLLGMEPAPSLVRVCRYSAMVALPVRSISWRVITCTGEAVSVVTRGMLEPVTVMRSRVVGFSAGALCASAAGAAMASVAGTSSRRARLVAMPAQRRFWRQAGCRWVGCFTVFSPGELRQETAGPAARDIDGRESMFSPGEATVKNRLIKMQAAAPCPGEAFNRASPRADAAQFSLKSTGTRP